MNAASKQKGENGMHHIKVEQLRDLLLRQMKKVSDEAVQTNGQVSAEQVEKLERLSKIAEICNSAKSPPARKRWPIIAVFAVTLIAVSFLLFVRVSETVIELDLSVSEVSFVLPVQQILTNTMRLDALGVSGLAEIQLPRTRTRDAKILPSSEFVRSAILISTITDEEQQGTVTLPAIMLSAGTRVWLRLTDVQHQYRMSLKSDGLDLRADVNGPVLVGLSGNQAEQFDFTSPKSIHLLPDSSEVDLDLLVWNTSQNLFSPQLVANNISLFRIDEFTDAERTIVRRVSTILSGKLYFESLNSKEYTLRPGEGIHFKRSEGEIRTLRIHDNHITLKFYGSIQGMKTGLGKTGRSIMPTYLEWLRARQGLSLLWGSTIYILGLIMAVLRWWRTSI